MVVLVNSLAVGVYGRLAAHNAVVADDQDCYSAFHAVSSVLGWTTPMSDARQEVGLWGMNDAGGPWFGDGAGGLRGRFQVSPEGDGGAVLPVEAFTDAALSTLERFGLLDLEGLEYYVPISEGGPATEHIQAGRNWFALAPSDRRTRLRITLDAGDSPLAADRADDVLRNLRDIAPSEEGLDPVRLDDHEQVDFAEPVPWRWWLGDGEPHTVSLSATASGPTALGLGRVVSLLVEACRMSGIADGLGVRIALDPT